MGRILAPFVIVYTLFRESVEQWLNDKATRLAAAIAFFTLLSMAPLILLLVAAGSFAFGTELVQTTIINQVRGFLGEQAAQVVHELMGRAAHGEGGRRATIIGLATALFGSTIVFFQLQDALNSIWGVPDKPWRGVLGFVRDRFFPLVMVIAIGALLIASFIFSTVVSTASGLVSQYIHVHPFWVQLLNFSVSLLILTLGFATIYKVLPEVRIAWTDAAVGGLVTALLFSGGRSLIAYYLGNFGAGSAYGAAGSLVVFMFWVYYSAQIFFFGAEFTQVYAKHYGSKIVPRIILPYQEKLPPPPPDAEPEPEQEEPHLVAGDEAVRELRQEHPRT
jgi:membrane protein